MPNSASNVPPFIPGLFIVSLLVIITVIIGWRNYSQRGNPRLAPALRVWAFWDVDGDGTEGGTNTERPKMWELDVVGRPTSEKGAWNHGWENIMPLSATSLTPESLPVGDSEALRNHATPNPSSRVSHPNFPALKFPMPSPLSPSPPPASADRLQVSVLISMPSPHTPTRRSPTPPPAPPECLSDSPPQASTSLSLWKEKVDWNHNPDGREAERSPEMALGVAVLPWRDDDVIT